MAAAAVRIVEDPSDRHSEESYFIQLADLNAYAALRHVSPSKRLGPEMWEELGETRLADANRIAGGPVGIKCFRPRPQKEDPRITGGPRGSPRRATRPGPDSEVRIAFLTEMSIVDLTPFYGNTCSRQFGSEVGLMLVSR